MRAIWPGLAASYIGAVVGAGFASGREVFHFFARYGEPGLLGAVLAGVLFAVFGAVTLRRIAQRRHRHYGDLLRDVCGPWVGAALDRLGAPFLFVGLAAVLAGAGALGWLLFGLPRWVGCLLLALLLAGAALGGRSAYLRLNLIALPVLLAGCAVAGLHGLLAPPHAPVLPPTRVPWPVAAVLYVAYNLLLAVAGLCVAAGDTDRPRESAVGGAVGGVVLGFLCACVTLALLPTAGALQTVELPLATALPQGAWRWMAYPLLFLAALWTTGTAAALSLGQRLRPRAPAVPAAVLTLAALPVALVGLVPIVAAAYPAIGYTGLVLLLALVATPLRPLRPWQQRRRPIP